MPSADLVRHDLLVVVAFLQMLLRFLFPISFLQLPIEISPSSYISSPPRPLPSSRTWGIHSGGHARSF